MAIALCMTAMVLTGCGKDPQDSSKEEETAETQATEGETQEAEEQTGVFGAFSAYTQDGEEVTQEIFADADLTMVNIWGTFCGPCIQEMPALAELSEEYAEKGLQIVGIVSDVMEPGGDAAQEVIDATGADYMHMVLSEDLYRNFLWQVQAVPTTIFVDKDGNQVGSIVMGAREKEDWVTVIDEMLGEVADEAE